MDRLTTDSVRLMHPLFQTGEGGSTPTSALSLWFNELGLETAVALNRLWHSRLPLIGKSSAAGSDIRAFYGASFDGMYYGVAIWTRPVARSLPQQTCLELRRLAIAPDAPRNTASRMLGWMVRDIRRRFPHIDRLVSYQDCEVHTGTIYRAAGWTATNRSKGDDWDRPNRSRRAAQSTAPKQRWEKWIGPKPQEVKGV